MICGKLNISHMTPGYCEMNGGTVMVTRAGNEKERGDKGREGREDVSRCRPDVYYTIEGNSNGPFDN